MEQKQSRLRENILWVGSESLTFLIFSLTAFLSARLPAQNLFYPTQYQKTFTQQYLQNVIEPITLYYIELAFLTIGSFLLIILAVRLPFRRIKNRRIKRSIKIAKILAVLFLVIKAIYVQAYVWRRLDEFPMYPHPTLARYLAYSVLLCVPYLIAITLWLFTPEIRKHYLNRKPPVKTP